MIGLDLTTAKRFFFDRDVVLRAMDRATAQALGKLGAFIRQRVRSSIRNRQAISKPGMPPSSHQGDYRRNILFAFESDRKSVVVGPIKFKSGDVPRLLEYGGAVRQPSGRVWIWRPRPHMLPALEAELPRLPGFWADAMRGTR